MPINGINSVLKNLFLTLSLSLLLGFAVFGSLTKADDSEINSETGATKLANKICMGGYITWPSIEPVGKFEEVVLLHLNLPYDTPNKEKIIAKFFNDNNSKLICGDDSDEFIRTSEHFLKRSLARSEHTYLIHMANSEGYEDYDWNFYEIVDGEKETILDYLDMIINDPDLAEDYDIPELKTLMRVIEENDGKRGREL